MTNKRKTRMYEPWGYQEENNYNSTENIIEGDFEAFLVDASYNRDDNKIHFTNKDGVEKASIDVSEFVKSDSIIEDVVYNDGILKITFTNGDIITINLSELIDENEFKDGLIVDDHIVKVLVDSSSDKYISVSEDGIKVAGIEADIQAEEARATSAETALDEKIDAEIARATDVETQLQAAIEEEGKRAQDAESALNTAISNEVTRAEAAEAALSRRNDTLNDELDGEKTIREAADVALGRRIDQEIDDRIADVDEEEARAKAAEEALQGAIDDEVSRATSAETALQAAIEAEGQRAQDAEAALDEKIDAEEERAMSAETAIINAIDELDEVKADKANAVASAEYVSSDTKIYFKDIDGNTISEIDASDFIKDGMIDNVEIKDGNLVITFNTESGKQPISIPLTDIFNPENYYDKAAVDAFVSALTASDEAILGAVDNVSTEVENEAQRALSAETDLQTAIDLKADKETTYTKEEVNELLAVKDAEIEEIQAAYDRLKDMVLDLYYATTYSIPTDSTLDSMLKSKSGEAKLTEDITTGTIAAGTAAKNIVKLTLGGKTVTFTGSTTNNPAMMFRNKQQVNIGGSGTIDAGGRVAVEAYGADCVVTLSGTMFGRPTYTTDRSGGELIYCYLGTINITDGIFKNNGDDKTFLLNCYDANYKNGTAKIVVTGGKFYDFNPADNTAEGEHTSFVPEGYHVEVSQDGDSTVYTVKKD